MITYDPIKFVHRITCDTPGCESVEFVTDEEVANSDPGEAEPCVLCAAVLGWYLVSENVHRCGRCTDKIRQKVHAAIDRILAAGGDAELAAAELAELARLYHVAP